MLIMAGTGGGKQLEELQKDIEDEERAKAALKTLNRKSTSVNLLELEDSPDRWWLKRRSTARMSPLERFKKKAEQ